MTSKYKILIVDDNEELCKNLSDILEFKGYGTTLAYSGHQAIEAIKNNKFNIVLMDVKMPGMDGMNTLKILKQIAPDTDIIMITAFADDIFYYKEGLRSTDPVVIQKPIDIDKLLGMLEDMLLKRKGR